MIKSPHNNLIFFLINCNFKVLIYLINLSIDKIINENGKEVTNSSTENKVKTLITNYIEMSPVYKYGEEYEEKNREKEKKQIKIKNMYIKNGKFYVQT